MIPLQEANSKSQYHYQDLLAENQRLRQELKRTQQEREILKKATAYFASLEK